MLNILIALINFERSTASLKISTALSSHFIYNPLKPIILKEVLGSLYVKQWLKAI